MHSGENDVQYVVLIYMIFVHCSKSVHAIGQNQSHVFFYLETTSRLSALLRIAHEKCALLKLCLFA